MTALLYGLHDREGAPHVPAGGWCVDTVALSDNPVPTDYTALRGDINWIVRVNWGYGSTGTIPLPEYDRLYCDRLAHYVHNSKGARIWIIGNEVNHEQERPNGVYITPARYADFFLRMRTQIKTIDSTAQVLPAPCAPYHANPINWLDYRQEMLNLIAANGGCDGIAIHAYTRSSNPQDVHSFAEMEAPLEDQYSGFMTYLDQIELVPPAFVGLPFYITEFNELLDGGWDDRNTGVVQEAYEEIDSHNQDPLFPESHVQCLVLYRWPKYDKWYIEGKQGVIDDFRAAVAKGYKSPAIGVTNVPETNLPYVPNESTPTEPTPALPPREISEDFKRRVPQIELTPDTYAKPYYRLIRAEYVPNGAQRFGPDHHILVEVLDKDGKRKMGVPVTFFWETAEVSVPTNKTSGPYAVDYGMTNHGNSYGVLVGDRPEDESDLVFGMGLGTIEQPDWNHHVTYYLVFQEVMPQAQPQPPTEQPQPASAIGYVIAPAGLHLRRLPDNKSDSLEIVRFGEAVRITAVANIKGWVRARYGNQEGWMSSEYITLTPPVHEVPAEPPQPTPEPVTPIRPGTLNPAVLEAILQVESGGRGFGNNGLLLIRFEAHIFVSKGGNPALFRHDQQQPWADQQWRRAPHEDWRNIHTGSQDDEYAALNFAATLNREAAYQSISMGAPQVMGFNHARIGYPNAVAMFGGFQRSLNAQLIGFVNYMLTDPALVVAINARDFRGIARGYNGGGNIDYAAGKYEAAYKQIVGSA